MSSLLLAFAAAGLTGLLWRLTRNFILPSPLDNVPGPDPSSWLKGELAEAYLSPSLLPQLLMTPPQVTLISFTIDMDGGGSMGSETIGIKW